ncbi:carboxypeptidase regulatory-like domain-containing protein [Silvibacterium acidisoli]|uniref:carboxypeptidase regulatory-like domain-containing protein n=1 Tax=Acidobacteriaceae bacterium ZG23-2 TaxID=2883246 RepID=UPI00406D30CA
MRTLVRSFFFPVFICLLLLQAFHPSFAQSAGQSGTLRGTVTDASGAVIPGATIELQNPVSGLHRTATADSQGQYQITNLPLNPYHMVVNATGFQSKMVDVEVRSYVPVVISTALTVGANATTITVEGNDLLEASSGLHTDIDRGAFAKVPLESQSSSLSSLVTLSSPGVSADSNGLFHGLGDHASNSFSIDGQPVTDQQSKVFSNQLPSNSVQSVEVIAGAPPAEYGDKTSLVINVTTRSGQGVKTPTGSLTTSYGSFGSASTGFDISYGGDNWGNFFEVDGLNSGRFLDPPEFKVLHDKGNEENVFDRLDRTLNSKDSLHLNLTYTRSWFQTPNAYDNLNVQNVISDGTSPNPVFANVGDADQHSKIETFNIAPLYTRIVNNNSVFNLGAYVRKDAYNYYPSGNPLADLGPANLQTSSIGQERTLTNAGAHTDFSYSKGVNNIKVGAMYEQTFLRENDRLGIVDPTYNAPCVDFAGNPVAGYSSTPDCGLGANPNYNPVLAPYDLTRGGSYYHYFGHTDVKELALYIEDQIKAGNWLFNVGIRGDIYNGLTVAHQAEPRLGVAYTIQPTNTVLRVSYARTLETPFNENLVLSSQGCLDPVLNPLLACTPGVAGTLTPGYRNEFHAGFQQAFSKYLVVSGEYIWKYTHGAFDFSVLGNTPITFPIDWHNSKIPGYALRVDMPELHGLSAYAVMSSVSARFFGPQIAGAGATVAASGNTYYPFRIDHDERFNQTTHMQYQLPWRRMPWIGFNWRYDSGLVAGSVPCYNTTDPNSGCAGTSITLPNGQPGIDLSGLTYDQQFEAGLICDGVKATPAAGFTQCDAGGLTSKLVKIPAPGTEDDDKNPPRIAPRNLFDMSVGDDNLFNGDRYKWSLHLTGVNITNSYSLYNFLSTFSGTHYVTPRALTAEVGFHF